LIVEIAIEMNSGAEQLTPIASTYFFVSFFSISLIASSSLSFDFKVNPLLSSKQIQALAPGRVGNNSNIEQASITVLKLSNARISASVRSQIN